MKKKTIHNVYKVYYYTVGSFVPIEAVHFNNVKNAMVYVKRLFSYGFDVSITINQSVDGIRKNFSYDKHIDFEQGKKVSYHTNSYIFNSKCKLI